MHVKDSQRIVQRFKMTIKVVIMVLLVLMVVVTSSVKKLLLNKLASL